MKLKHKVQFIGPELKLLIKPKINMKLSKKSYSNLQN